MRIFSHSRISWLRAVRAGTLASLFWNLQKAWMSPHSAMPCAVSRSRIRCFMQSFAALGFLVCHFGERRKHFRPTQCRFWSTPPIPTVIFFAKSFLDPEASTFWKFTFFPALKKPHCWRSGPTWSSMDAGPNWRCRKSHILRGIPASPPSLLPPGECPFLRLQASWRDGQARGPL